MGVPFYSGPYTVNSVITHACHNPYPVTAHSNIYRWQSQLFRAWTLPVSHTLLYPIA